MKVGSLLWLRDQFTCVKLCISLSAITSDESHITRRKRDQFLSIQINQFYMTNFNGIAFPLLFRNLNTHEEKEKMEVLLLLICWITTLNSFSTLSCFTSHSLLGFTQHIPDFIKGWTTFSTNSNYFICCWIDWRLPPWNRDPCPGFGCFHSKNTTNIILLGFHACHVHWGAQTEMGAAFVVFHLYIRFKSITVWLIVIYYLAYRLDEAEVKTAIFVAVF